MNLDENPNDSTLTRELRDSLSELTAPARPSLAAITSRGRAHQRRRLAGFASLGITGVAAATALALSLTGVLGAAPASSTARTRTAAFTLTTNANGTDTLALTQRVFLDPAALQHALAHAGIPALVKTGTSCSSTPAPHSHGMPPVTIGPGSQAQAAGGGGLGSMALFEPRPAPKIKGKDVIRYVIHPASIPAGTELFFGYFYANKYQVVASQLIDTSSYTCSSQAPFVTPSSRA